MKKIIKPAILGLLMIGTITIPYSSVTAQNVVVVLSSELPAYQETLKGFEESYGQSVPTFNLLNKSGIPRTTRVIVAIGGKAAQASYGAQSAAFIYCAAPGIYVNPTQHSGGLYKVYVSPPPELLIGKIRLLQPSIHRLGAFYMDASAAKYGSILQVEGERRGLSIIIDKINAQEDLLAHLQAINRHIEALWLPPDPLLLTPETFSLIRQYAWNNNIPLYVSLDSLLEKGAAASIAISLREMGRKAGTIAKQALTGIPNSSQNSFGDKVTVSVNLSAAKECGLDIPDAALKQTDRIIR